MPLSEHEQRLLEQMEQQLLSDDPRFASTMRGPRSAPAARRRLVIGGFGVLVSLALLVLGVVVWHTIWLAAAAFVVMLTSLIYAWPTGGRTASGPTGVVAPDGSAVRRTGSSRQPQARHRPGARASKPPARGTFMQRLEQRWERRRDSGWS